MLYPSSTTAALFFICVASTIYTSLAFAPALPFQTRLYTTACVDTAQCASRNEDDEDTTAESEIPCLPPIGESSFTGESSSTTNSADSEDSETIRIGTERFELQYTCKICETRNSHKVSRMGEWHMHYMIYDIWLCLFGWKTKTCLINDQFEKKTD